MLLLEPLFEFHKLLFVTMPGGVTMNKFQFALPELAFTQGDASLSVMPTKFSTYFFLIIVGYQTKGLVSHNLFIIYISYVEIPVVLSVDFKVGVILDFRETAGRTPQELLREPRYESHNVPLPATTPGGTT